MLKCRHKHIYSLVEKKHYLSLYNLYFLFFYFCNKSTLILLQLTNWAILNDTSENRQL